MLTTLLKEHQLKTQKHKEKCIAKKQEAIIASKALVSEVVDNVNERVSKAYINQKNIDLASKQLQQQISQFIKNSGQWLTLIESFHTSLKEIGDIENWTKTIEEDIKDISKFLDGKYSNIKSGGNS